MFFYNSRRFVETGDFSSCLVGNAPLIVERRSGRLLEAGKARDISFYVSIDSVDNCFSAPLRPTVRRIRLEDALARRRLKWNT